MWVWLSIQLLKMKQSYYNVIYLKNFNDIRRKARLPDNKSVNREKRIQVSLFHHTLLTILLSAESMSPETFTKSDINTQLIYCSTYIIHTIYKQKSSARSSVPARKWLLRNGHLSVLPFNMERD